MEGYPNQTRVLWPVSLKLQGNEQGQLRDMVYELFTWKEQVKREYLRANLTRRHLTWV